MPCQACIKRRARIAHYTRIARERLRELIDKRTNRVSPSSDQTGKADRAADDGDTRANDGADI